MTDIARLSTKNKEMNEKIACEKCGSEMRPYQEGRTGGMLCPKCGWGWVTTITSAIDTDETLYTVKISKPSKMTNDLMKLYAELSGTNYVQTKQALEEGNAEISGLAADIQKMLQRLYEAGLEFTITPDYPYDIDISKVY
jgi:uncharacterized Zn finger protein (UPF0148 family)